MPTEIFTKEQFEASLPVDKISGEPLWGETSIGTEYTYALPVVTNGEIASAVILVQSSIRRGRSKCDASGKNSIRAWLADADDFSIPLAEKVVRWTARTLNWRDNLKDQLRELWKIGLLLGRCPNCGQTLRVRTSKTEKNPDRKFTACPGPKDRCSYFGVWLDEEIK